MILKLETFNKEIMSENYNTGRWGDTKSREDIIIPLGFLSHRALHMKYNPKA